MAKRRKSTSKEPSKLEVFGGFVIFVLGVWLFLGFCLPLMFRISTLWDRYLFEVLG